MTTDFDASRYERALERWRVLAERRLEHMSLLYETGRWRRYFSEEKFLIIIRETTAAVETWRRLAPGEVAVPHLFEPPGESTFVHTPPPPLPYSAEPQRSVA